MAIGNMVFNEVVQQLQCDDCSLVFCDFRQFLLHRIHHFSLFQGGITEESLMEGSSPLCTVKHLDGFKDTRLKKQELPCDDCSLVFCDFKQFVLHRKCHTSLFRDFTTEETLKEGSCPLCFVKHFEDLKGTILQDQETDSKVMRCKYYPNCIEEFHRLSKFIKHTKEVHNDDKPYACQQCNFTARRYQALKHHIYSHIGYKMFECHLCLKKYGTKISLSKHLLSKHKDNIKTHGCSVCSKKYAAATDLKRHLKIHFPSTETFKCQLCPREYSKKKSFKYHLQAHYRKFKCHLCPEEFSTKPRLNSHLLSSHNEVNTKSYDCSYCGKKFYERNELTEHLKSHSPATETAPKIFKCHICFRLLSSKLRLKTHLETHNNSHPKIICDICSKQFTRRDSLKRHELIHTEEKLGKNAYDCKNCGKEFLMKRSLVIHLDPEKESKNMLCCKKCPRTFKNFNCFTYHERTHTEFLCEVCKKKCFTLRGFKKHLEAHGIKLNIDSSSALIAELTSDLENPIKCSLCPKVYRTKLGLKYHLRKHEGKEPHACKECGETFMAEMLLEAHLNPEKEIKQPISCKECSETFNNINCFNYHKRSHMEEFLCGVCDATCYTRQGMKMHLAKHGMNLGP